MEKLRAAHVPPDNTAWEKQPWRHTAARAAWSLQPRFHPWLGQAGLGVLSMESVSIVLPAFLFMKLRKTTQ